MIEYFTFILLASAFVVGYALGCIMMFSQLKKEIAYRDEIVTGLRAAFLRIAR